MANDIHRFTEAMAAACSAFEAAKFSEEARVIIADDGGSIISLAFVPKSLGGQGLVIERSHGDTGTKETQPLWDAPAGTMVRAAPLLSRLYGLCKGRHQASQENIRVATEAVDKFLGELAVNETIQQELSLEAGDRHD